MSISDSDARARMVVLFSERSDNIAEILKEAGVDPARDFRHRNFAIGISPARISADAMSPDGISPGRFSGTRNSPA